METEPSMTYNLVPYYFMLVPALLVISGFSKRMGGRVWVSVVLTCIPIFGYFYFFYYCYRTVIYLLDTTNSLKDWEVHRLKAIEPNQLLSVSK